MKKTVAKRRKNVKTKEMTQYTILLMQIFVKPIPIFPWVREGGGWGGGRSLLGHMFREISQIFWNTIADFRSDSRKGIFILVCSRII